MARVVLFEMNSQEPEKAAAFYGSVFGWRFGQPNWGYWPTTTGPADQAGIDGGISKGPADYSHGTRVTIEVESIDEAIARAVEHGAQVVREKMAFDQFYLAYLVDPVGIGFGLIQYIRPGGMAG